MPLLYASTGVDMRFTNGLDPDPTAWCVTHGFLVPTRATLYTSSHWRRAVSVGMRGGSRCGQLDCPL